MFLNLNIAADSMETVREDSPLQVMTQEGAATVFHDQFGFAIGYRTSDRLAVAAPYRWKTAESAMIDARRLTAFMLN